VTAHPAFRDVLVPSDNVFCYDVDKVNNFFAGSGFAFRAMLHGCVRLAVRFDFLAGLPIKGLELQSGQVDRCMSEYDLDTWTVPDLISNDDVRRIGAR